jgi:hypothetical protein
MRPGLRSIVPLLAVLCLICWLPAADAAAQPADVVTVGTVTAGPSLVDVPVYIRDVSTTPIGIDQPPGSKIQSFSIKVDYAPASAISSISFSRAGITTSLTPTAQFTPSTASSVSLVDTFQEATNPIPFTLDGAAPGNLVGHLVVQLSPSAAPGSAITLTLDPAVTTLANQDGTTSEKTAFGNLTLVNGAINIPVGFVYDVPALSLGWLVALGLALAVVALRGR